MFTIKQLRREFYSQIMSYQENPNGVIESSELPGPRSQVELSDPYETLRGISALQRDAVEDHDLFTEQLLALSDAQEMRALADSIIPTQEELGDLNISDLNPELRREIFETRLVNISKTELPTSGEDGPIRILEREYVEGLASDYGINPDVLLRLRATDFRDSLSWEVDQISDNYREILNELQSISDATGINISDMSTSDILSLYEEMGDNDDGESSNVPLAPEVAAAEGIEVRRDSDGGFQIDPNTPGYRQTQDGSVVGPPGAPYSRGGQVYRGSGEISTEVAAELDRSYTGLRENERTDMSETHLRRLEGTANFESKKDIIEHRIPAEWHGSAVELAKRVDNFNPSYPILLASMTERRGLVCYPDGRVDEFPIIIGRGGFREGAHSGGATTPTYEVFNFNMNTKITGRGNDASNGGSNTVLGASIQSPEAAASGGKWWHGVADHRIPDGATLGCIGAKQENMMMAARAVIEAGGGYGFHTRTRDQ